MNKRYPTVPQISGAHPRFKYSAPWSECRIIHEHNCMGTRLLVVGDPDNGCYEWVIITSSKVAAHSNDGYGISEVALRDGLIEAFKDCFTSPGAKPVISSNVAVAAVSLQRARREESELLRPVRQCVTATLQEEAIAEPHTASDEPSKSQAATGSPSFQPQENADKPTTSAPASAQAMCQSESIAGKPDQSLDGTILHTPEMPQASYPQGSGQNSSTAGSHSPARGSFQSKKNSSSHHGDACGDINCDGQCDDRAPLIILIDACASVDAARSAVANATPAALRNAARYLRVNKHDLPSAITRRVRERLSKAA
ncbi:hypothetical protein [Prosthecobacter sp.]|jgi:hypothetical protein|uniref:hypothetical protein n=1 Tax=Prosthecobacter sp. TaxID=1965333 RepID=UPI0037C9F030